MLVERQFKYFRCTLRLAGAPRQIAQRTGAACRTARRGGLSRKRPTLRRPVLWRSNWWQANLAGRLLRLPDPANRST
jgi:hypothetical protein